MGRSKTPKKTPTPPWLTGRDYEFNQHKKMPPWTKLDPSLTHDDLFCALSPGARYLYLVMCNHAGDQADQWFVFTVRNAEKVGFTKNTFYRLAKELVSHGFLQTKRGGIPEGWEHARFAPSYFRASPELWKGKG